MKPPNVYEFQIIHFQPWRLIDFIGQISWPGCYNYSSFRSKSIPNHSEEIVHLTGLRLVYQFNALHILVTTLNYDLTDSTAVARLHQKTSL